MGWHKMIEVQSGQSDETFEELCICGEESCVGNCMISKTHQWAIENAEYFAKLAEDSNDIATFSEIAEEYQIIAEAIKNIVRLGEEI